MAELRVVCRLFRYHGSANCRYLISDDPLLQFRKRPADGSGDYASYRLDRGLPHRLHRIIHCRSHRCSDFRFFDHLSLTLYGCGDPMGYRDSARLRLFYGSDLYPSLGKDFRLGLRFRFPGKGNEPFYRRLAFMLLEGFPCRVQFFLADRGFYRPGRRGF